MSRADALKIALTRSPRAYRLARRPYATARYLLRRPHDPDYAAFALFEGEGPFLDVGANAGMSALSFRLARRRNAIVSIEPNPFHEGDLRFTGRLVRRFGYRLWAAGEADGRMTLHIPVYRGVPLTTEASLWRDGVTGSTSLRARLGHRMDSPEFEIVAREVPVRRLDGLGLDPSFVKLDVQGAEDVALKGLRETLERARPVLLIESAGEEVVRRLDGMDYEPLAYDAARHMLVPGRFGAVNTFFRPRP